jgi:GT2 family glycosyltransferase
VALQAAVIAVDSGLSPECRTALMSSGGVGVAPARLPFVFAQAVNDGVAHAVDATMLAKIPLDGVFVMNDDAVFCSAYPIDAMHKVLARAGSWGVISARIDGVGTVGNEEQEQALAPHEIVETSRTVCFVGVLIPVAAWGRIGLMDERFVGYGHDDDDYNRRARLAGLNVGITGAFAVRHGIAGKPMHGTYGRLFTPEEHTAMYEENQRRYIDKWGGA